ncbi:MAG: type II toxin-antitoxin system VapC family toxin [Methylocystis sp.]
MSLVLDASTTLSWYFDDETTPVTDAVLEQVASGGAVTPSLWRLEVANALQMALRRKRITRSYRDEVLTQPRDMPISIDFETDAQAWTATLSLSERFSLTLYDATYLELAQRQNLPLATLDQELRAAAKALEIKVFN